MNRSFIFSASIFNTVMQKRTSYAGQHKIQRTVIDIEIASMK